MFFSVNHLNQSTFRQNASLRVQNTLYRIIRPAICAKSNHAEVQAFFNALDALDDKEGGDMVARTLRVTGKLWRLLFSVASHPVCTTQPVYSFPEFTQALFFNNEERLWMWVVACFGPFGGQQSSHLHKYAYSIEHISSVLSRNSPYFAQVHGTTIKFPTKPPIH